MTRGTMGAPRRATDHEEADVSAPRRPDARPDERFDEPAPDQAPDQATDQAADQDTSSGGLPAGLPPGMLEALYARPSRARTALVVVPLLAGLGVAAYVGSTLLWPGDDEPSASSGTGSDAATDAVTCWDGAEKTDERSCALPTGRDGLRHVFPSFDPDRLDCRDELAANPQYQRPAMWTCDVSIAGPVQITYSQVSGAKAARRYFDKLHGVESNADRSSSGVRRERWRASRLESGPDEGRWGGSFLLRGAPYAVTVVAQRRPDVGRALDRRVSVRPLDELRLAAPESDPSGEG